MRVLVCGGRNFSDDQYSDEVLDNLHESRGPITVIINGGAHGADACARWWAESRKVKCVTVPANWAEFGKAAGPIRNERMLRDFKPDMVVAFLGGRGTKDMVRRAELAGVEVLRATSSHTASKL
jgi:hypothetical protein